jgi:hypothetical protein
VIGEGRFTAASAAILLYRKRIRSSQTVNYHNASPSHIRDQSRTRLTPRVAPSGHPAECSRRSRPGCPADSDNPAGREQVVTPSLEPLIPESTSTRTEARELEAPETPSQWLAMRPGHCRGLVRGLLHWPRTLETREGPGLRAHVMESVIRLYVEWSLAPLSDSSPQCGPTRAGEPERGASCASQRFVLQGRRAR